MVYTVPVVLLDTVSVCVCVCVCTRVGGVWVLVWRARNACSAATQVLMGWPGVAHLVVQRYGVRRLVFYTPRGQGTAAAVAGHVCPMRAKKCDTRAQLGSPAALARRRLGRGR